MCELCSWCGRMAHGLSWPNRRIAGLPDKTRLIPSVLIRSLNPSRTEKLLPAVPDCPLHTDRQPYESRSINRITRCADAAVQVQTLGQDGDRTFSLTVAIVFLPATTCILYLWWWAGSQLALCTPYLPVRFGATHAANTLTIVYATMHAPLIRLRHAGAHGNSFNLILLSVQIVLML